MKNNKSYPLYNLPLIKNLKDMLGRRNAALPDSYAFGYSEGKKEIRKTTSDFCRDVDSLGSYLLSRGYQGKHVAVIGENSYEWVVSFLALVNGGCVAVPVDKEYSAGEVRKLLDKSDCCAVIVSDTYSELVTDNKNIDIILMSEIPEYINQGSRIICDGDLSFINYSVDENALAAIFFTSGTTGDSKGVMLSHKNMASDINAACRNFELEGDTLAVLPFHHTFGLITAVFKVFNYNKGVYINKSLKKLKQDIASSKPQTIFMVPLFIETFYKQITDTARKAGKYDKLMSGMKISNFLMRLGVDCRKKMFSDVIAAFGGNIEYIISGGAPLQQKYIDDFYSWGITILNGYGITECSPVLSVNRNHHITDGSVGMVLDGCEVKTDESGEIIVKGDNVMLGYYKDEKSTNEVLKDGWYHTGDLGYVDRSGFMFLTGRKKNLIILSNGENVSPEEIEAYLYEDDGVSEAVVYEENNSIIAEIFPVESHFQDKEYFNQLARKINSTQPKFKRISEVKIRDNEFIKNSTKKIMRHKIKE